MNQKERTALLDEAKNFFRDTIVVNHASKLRTLSKISTYNYNPFLVRYLAKFFTGQDDSISIAKVLLYPRILGTSINTSFGQNIQKFCSQVLKKYGSAIPGIDIEFIDFSDGRRKYCQIKAGPDTINKDDVVTIVGHFNAIKGIARTNNLDLRATDLVIGTLYGIEKELNGNYKKLQQSYEVIVGREFWTRLTGDKNLYIDLIKTFCQVADDVDGKKKIKKTLSLLSEDIDNSEDFK